jgi:hypothetical protein
MAAATVLSNAGRALITLRLAGLSSVAAGTATAQYMAWGTNSSATAAASATALATECVAGSSAGQIVGYARQAITPSQATTSVTNDTYKQVGTLSMGGTVTPVAIYECGTFDALTSGNMLVYATFGAITLSGTDTLAITLLLQFN